MKENDSLKQILVEFFNLPVACPSEDLTQQAIPAWDSLAMVRLIMELQSAFSVQFDLEEIERLGSYSQIRDALLRKGVSL